MITAKEARKNYESNRKILDEILGAISNRISRECIEKTSITIHLTNDEKYKHKGELVVYGVEYLDNVVTELKKFGYEVFVHSGQPFLIHPGTFVCTIGVSW